MLLNGNVPCRFTRSSPRDYLQCIDGKLEVFQSGAHAFEAGLAVANEFAMGACAIHSGGLDRNRLPSQVAAPLKWEEPSCFWTPCPESRSTFQFACRSYAAKPVSESQNGQGLRIPGSDLAHAAPIYVHPPAALKVSAEGRVMLTERESQEPRKIQKKQRICAYLNRFGRWLASGPKPCV